MIENNQKLIQLEFKAENIYAGTKNSYFKHL